MSTLVSTLTAVVLVIAIQALFGAAPERWLVDYVTRRPDPRTPVSQQQRRFGSAMPGVLMMSGPPAVAGTLNPVYWSKPRGYRHG